MLEVGIGKWLLLEQDEAGIVRLWLWDESDGKDASIATLKPEDIDDLIRVLTEIKTKVAEAAPDNS